MEHQHNAKKGKGLISSFFKKRDRHDNEGSSNPPSTPIQNQSNQSNSILMEQEPSILDLQSSTSIDRDPRKRKQMWEHSVNARDDIRRAYLKVGPNQPILEVYPVIKFGNRSFQKRWFEKFHWLEYSVSTYKAYCLYCFLFMSDVNIPSSSARVKEGFNNWKKINQGNKCEFLTHVGSAATSPHTMCLRRAEDLMRPLGHIDKVMHAKSTIEKEKNWLRLKTSIISLRWLAVQGCAFRSHDESSSPSNRGNFIELVKAFADMNKEVSDVLDSAAPKNAKYIAPDIQKEILHIIANRVRRMICDELGDIYFCILVNEAHDISKQEQMEIILRFVNDRGILT